MNRKSREGREERDIRDAVRVEVSKTGHSFSNQSVQIFVFYTPVVQINEVLR